MRQNPCKYCGSEYHTTFKCLRKRTYYLRHKPTKKIKHARLRRESIKTRDKRQATSREWNKLNKPDKDGFYTCWLQISKYCPVKIHYEFSEHEHVYPKNKFPEFKYVVLNIKPSCDACNALKLSNTPEQLAIYYPNIAKLIETPEWKAWKVKLWRYYKPELH